MTTCKAASMKKNLKDLPRRPPTDEEIAREEIARINARLRHFRGVAAGLMNRALEILREVWDSCQDPRSWEEILDGVPEPEARTPAGGWPQFHEKLHLLGTYIDHARRLCEGTIENPGQKEREVESCPANSKSCQTTGNPSRTAKTSLPKKN
ncbi:MAG: hypothetical protein QME75_13045 [Deltaproteobacteria bacterium]|nr:hypothetical protein [Deltaproteobacteria bacterium]